MTKLSENQRAALKLVVREPDNNRYGWGSSCTNPTMSALERRGLVRVEFDRSKGYPGYPWSRWVATPMGIDEANGLFDAAAIRRADDRPYVIPGA